MKRLNLACTLIAGALSLSAAHAQTVTINAGGSSLAGPTYIQEFQLYTNGNTSTGGTLAPHSSILFSYEAVGSGGAQKAFLNNDITQYEAPNVTSGTLVYGTIAGTTVHVGASDAPLALNTATSGEVNGLSSAATGSYQSGINSSGSSTDGPLIQVPTFGVPVTLAYNSTKTLKLTDAQICGIFSGEITDWHTLLSSVKAGTTINVVYFSNSSGTTYLLTQHLHAVCNSTNSTFPTLPVPVTKYFYSTTSANKPVFLTAPPANFTGEAASSAAAAQLVATTNSLGYLSPDFTSIAPKSPNTTALKVAAVQNSANGVYYSPTVAATESGLANPGAGSTDTTPPVGLTASMDPQNWVPSIPLTNLGYPIVGYGTWEISTCYANKTIGTAITNFLTLQYGNAAYETIIKNNGFAPLVNTAATKFITTVHNAFLSNKSGFNLNIDNATTCASYAGR